MKPAKTMLLAALVVVALSIFVCKRQPLAPQKHKTAMAPPAKPPAPVFTPVPRPKATPPPQEKLAVKAETQPAQPPAPQKPQAQAAPQTNNPDEPRRDPMARTALSLVGADPDAEQYWLGAIYDTTLSDQEREDLMEDLNEEGLSDPRNPTSDDMVLIFNRVVTIENVLPDADAFMVPHLMEAYKDLLGLLNGRAPQ